MKLLGSLKELVKIVFRTAGGKEVEMQPAEQTAAGPVTIEIPDVGAGGSDTVVMEAAGATLSNKTISGDNNTLSNIGISTLKTELTDADKAIVRDVTGAVVSAKITDTNVDAAAAISRAKLAAGTADHVLINDGSGNFSSEAQVSKSRGGTGADNSSVTFPSTGTIVTEDATQTLVNKQVSSTADMTGALLLPSGTEAERPTPSTGMVRHNSDTDSFEGYAAGTWASIGGGGTVDRITQVGHGFVVGEILYLNGSTYTKAIATAANTAEIVGMVSRVIDADTFEMTLSGEVGGLSGLTAGEAYFLSDTTAGAISATEPSVVGYISIPVGVASSTTSFYVAPKRGVVVGAANALTQIPLSNNTTNTVQDVSDYNAGELSGWVEIDATTPYKFYVNAQFSENGAGTDFNVSYQTSGDTPPAGFSIVITSAGILQAVMPNLGGFLSASINYGLNVAAVGASLPLSISARNVVGDTSGTAVPAGYVGEIKELNSTLNPVTASWTTSPAILVPKGSWLVQVYGAGSGNAGTRTSMSVGFSTDSSSTGFSDQTGGENIFQAAIGTDGRGSVQGHGYVNLANDTNYYIKTLSFGANSVDAITHRLKFIRIS